MAKLEDLTGPGSPLLEVPREGFDEVLKKTKQAIFQGEPPLFAAAGEIREFASLELGIRLLGRLEPRDLASYVQGFITPLDLILLAHSRISEGAKVASERVEQLSASAPKDEPSYQEYLLRNLEDAAHSLWDDLTCGGIFELVAHHPFEQSQYFSAGVEVSKVMFLALVMNSTFAVVWKVKKRPKWTSFKPLFGEQANRSHAQPGKAGWVSRPLWFSGKRSISSKLLPRAGPSVRAVIGPESVRR